MAAAYLTLARLFELLEYFPLTGLFVWRINRQGQVKAADVAGCMDGRGYIHIKIDGRLYKAHRLAFFYMTGEWPKAFIDHKDGARTNNRWANLREATHSQNVQNIRTAPCNGQLRLLGVSFYARNQRWRSCITLDGKQRFLGYFDTPEAAHDAYLAEKRRIHPFCTI